jgi:PD-(D/E)XK endonuclease
VEWTTNDKGAIAEAELFAAAVRLGVVVLRPFPDGRRYDLVFDVGGRLLRVQCKWGRVVGDVVVVRTGTSRHTPRGYVTTTYTADEIDAFGVYCGDLNRCLLLPINDAVGQSNVHLRLAPARNNQKASIKMAEDYDLARMIGHLGAIAQLGERSAGSRKVGGSNPPSSTPQAAQPRGLFAV